MLRSRATTIHLDPPSRTPSSFRLIASLQVEYLTSSQNVHIENRALTSIPPEVFQNRSIKTLVLTRNQLETLPAAISGLKTLR